MRLRRFLVLGAAAASLLCFVAALRFVHSQTPPTLPFDPAKVHRTPAPTTTTTSTVKPTEAPHQEPVVPMEPKEDLAVPEVKTKGNPNVHIFYYPWYGHPQYDNGTYLHWNHPYLPHWNAQENAKWPKGAHVPPDDVGANFYPQLGAYSSRDLGVIEQHMRWISDAGVGVLAVSWYPAGRGDDNGRSWEDLIPIIFDAAHKQGLKVTLHLEPYKERTASSVREDLVYIMKTYGAHPALYRYEHMGETKPLIYAYDSYLVPTTEWRSILRSDGVVTIRGTEADVFLIGLLVKDSDRTEVVKAGFDGFYTYFAADGFTYGATQHNWASMSAFARKNKMVFIPSVGPGYIDLRVRPWNKVNVRPRHNGTYYTNAWNAAIASRGRSDVLLAVQHKILEFTPPGEPASVALVALDRLPHGVILDALRRREVPENLCNMIPSRLSGREQAVGSAVPPFPSSVVSVTSFNEWHEGTQIEPAVRKEAGDGFRYLDYYPMQSTFYLTLTKHMVDSFATQERKDLMADAANLAAAALP